MKTMFYLAGKATAKERLRQMRDRVVAGVFGLADCNSRWLDHNLIESEVDKAGLLIEAQNDIDDVAACDAFILDTADESTTGGREVEFGYALAHDLYTIVVGPQRNIFHYMADEHYDDWLDYTASRWWPHD